MAHFVGITGGIASGKSTVAKWLGEAGFRVVDADQVVAELYQPGGKGAAAVEQLFGGDVLTEDGAVDRPKVASIVFQDPEARGKLEAAIHPLVGRHLQEIAANAQGVVIYEATLMVESGSAELCDLVISVEAPEELRLQRAVARGMSQSDALGRIAAQGDGMLRRAAADRILQNTGTLDDLRVSVDRLIDELREHDG